MAKPESSSSQLLQLALAGITFYGVQESSATVGLPGGAELGTGLTGGLAAILAFFIPKIISVWSPKLGAWLLKLFKGVAPSEDELAQKFIDFLLEFFGKRKSEKAVEAVESLQQCLFECKKVGIHEHGEKDN